MSQTHDNIDALGLNTERFRPESKTIISTIAELCARLDNNFKARLVKGADYLELEDDVLQTVNDADRIYRNKILSINDKIELDECILCGKTKHRHKVSLPIPTCVCFKPRLATVKGIKLVERCECGFKKRMHRGQPAEYTWKVRGCDTYKPVQTVEITYEEAR